MAKRIRPLIPRIKIGEQFIARPIAMLKSKAYRSLKLADQKILDRLEIEHARHAGRRNGDLVCTYADLKKYGVRRPSIPDALRRLVQLGFIEITKQGRLSYGDLRNPSHYRLTYLHTYEDGKPIAATHEWRRLEKQKTGHENETGTGHESETGKPDSPDTKTRLQPEKPDTKAGLPSRSTGRWGGGLRDGKSISNPAEQSPLSRREEVVVPPPTFPTRASLTVESSLGRLH